MRKSWLNLFQTKSYKWKAQQWKTINNWRVTLGNNVFLKISNGAPFQDGCLTDPITKEMRTPQYGVSMFCVFPVSSLQERGRNYGCGIKHVLIFLIMLHLIAKKVGLTHSLSHLQHGMARRQSTSLFQRQQSPLGLNKCSKLTPLVVFDWGLSVGWVLFKPQVSYSIATRECKSRFEFWTRNLKDERHINVLRNWWIVTMLEGSIVA